MAFEDTPEFCVELTDIGEQCLSGDLLIAAIVFELCCYFWMFVGGYKLVQKLLSKNKRVRLTN